MANFQAPELTRLEFDYRDVPKDIKIEVAKNILSQLQELVMDGSPETEVRRTYFTERDRTKSLGTTF
jgi:hypothetical protein